MPLSKSNIVGATLAIISSTALFVYVALVFLHSAAAHGLVHDFKYFVQFTAQTSLGVTTGHPLEKLFQSRVLGPYLIKALSFGSINHYGAAYVFFQIATVAIAAFLCWRLGRKYGGSDKNALFALMLFVMCFAMLLSPPYLYSWDFIDIIVFLVFIDFVLSDLSLPWFLGLFAIAIWNRDSANFIALWLIVDPAVRFFYERRYNLPKTPLNWHRVIAGIICIGVGLLIAELLKENLLVEETGPKFGMTTDVGNRYNLALGRNIYFLSHPFSELKFWIAVPFIAVVISFGMKLVRLDPQRYLSIFLIELSMLLALLLAGLFGETRVFLILVPFLVISSVLVSGSSRSISPT